MKVATCRSCGKSIMWAKTDGGSNIPLDAEYVLDTGQVPVPVSGWFVIDGATVHRVKKGTTLPPGSRRHVSHFATCPNAAQHRKPRGKKNT